MISEPGKLVVGLIRGKKVKIIEHFEKVWVCRNLLGTRVGHTIQLWRSALLDGSPFLPPNTHRHHPKKRKGMYMQELTPRKNWPPHLCPWRIDPYTCPVRKWMTEYKQKSTPIWVLVDLN
jgi:hypothetical protein